MNSNIKLSDYLAKFLREIGVKHVFAINGGAVAHIMDSLDRVEGITYICNQHEQASAMAADAYSRVSENIGVTVATTGPGATNLVTGVTCSYYDSVPMLVITGQVSRFRSSVLNSLKVRQLGFQECDHLGIFAPITKYSVAVNDAKMIKYELEKAIYLAKNGRPGPVHLDIPDDVQREMICEKDLVGFTPPPVEEKKYNNKNFYTEIKSSLKLAKRPCLILGHGVVVAGASEIAQKLAQKLKIPVGLTWATRHLINNPEIETFDFGTNGSRFGNFTVQNADFILSIGSRLDTHATGSPVNTFGREAKKYIVDIDQYELEKFDRYNNEIENKEFIWNNFQEDAAVAVEELLKLDFEVNSTNLLTWVNHIKSWKTQFPLCKESDKDQSLGSVSPYYFIEELSKHVSSDAIIIADTGANLTQFMTTFRPKDGQYIFSALNCTPMGYSLPASIGASLLSGDREVICITGDGGVLMNIQELGTIDSLKLKNIKIFVFNDKGFGIIKRTQDDWLDSNYAGSDSTTGVATPDFCKVAEGFRVASEIIQNNSEVHNKLTSIFKQKDSILVELNISSENRPDPMLKYGRPLEDTSPLLDRAVFKKNMIVKMLPVSEKD